MKRNKKSGVFSDKAPVRGGPGVYADVRGLQRFGMVRRLRKRASGMAARCLVSRLSECLLVINEQAAGLLLVKGTPGIPEVQRTSGISESDPMILQRYYCYRPIAVLGSDCQNGRKERMVIPLSARFAHKA